MNEELGKIQNSEFGIQNEDEGDTAWGGGVSCNVN
mgnify:CR=1 FL=1